MNKASSDLPLSALALLADDIELLSSNASLSYKVFKPFQELLKSFDEELISQIRLMLESYSSLLTHLENQLDAWLIQSLNANQMQEVMRLQKLIIDAKGNMIALGSWVNLPTASYTTECIH